jgi:hypothetical protein
VLSQQYLSRLKLVFADQSARFEQIGRRRFFLSLSRWSAVPVKPYGLAQFDSRRFIARSGSHRRS